MLPARKYHDAAAAFAAGAGVLLIASGFKEVPGVISYLDPLDSMWGLLMILGSLGAGIGALLRTRDSDKHRRRYWSVSLERPSWLLIAACTIIFCIGVVYEFGWVDAALTLGFTGFVIATCTGHWWVIQRAARAEATL